MDLNKFQDFMFNKVLTMKNLKIALAVALVVVSVWVYISNTKQIKELTTDKEKLEKEILEKDTMIVYGKGVYSKLVNQFNTSKNLNDVLKRENKNLFEQIQKNKERILSNTGFTVSMKPKETLSYNVKILVKENDNGLKDSTFNYTAKYPTDVNPFIEYEGNVDYKNKLVRSKWNFNPAKVNVVLTEKENGMWNTYVDAPEYFQIGDLTVNSLPKAEIVKVKEKKVSLYGGAGYMRMGDNSRPSVNVGVGTKKWLLTGGYAGKNAHNITLMRKF